MAWCVPASPTPVGVAANVPGQVRSSLLRYRFGGDVRAGQIGVESTGDIRVLVLRGEHDLSTAPDVRAHVEEAVIAGGDVVADLSEASFIDSSILGVLVAGFRSVTTGAPAGRFAVVAVPGSSVTRLFDLVSV
ncbi:MAG: STAS domain-containing protein, partial [Jatrophihabitantaceae bacterium]